MNDQKYLEQWMQEPRSPADCSGNPVAERLQQAIPAKEFLAIRYYGGSSPGMERRIRPLEVFECAGMLYVDAYCESRDETRCFKICRIEIEGINKIAFNEIAFGESAPDPVGRTSVNKQGGGCLVMLAVIPIGAGALRVLAHWL